MVILSIFWKCNFQSHDWSFDLLKNDTFDLMIFDQSNISLLEDSKIFLCSKGPIPTPTCVNKKYCFKFKMKEICYLLKILFWYHKTPKNKLHICISACFSWGPLPPTSPLMYENISEKIVIYLYRHGIELLL